MTNSKSQTLLIILTSLTFSYQISHAEVACIRANPTSAAIKNMIFNSELSPQAQTRYLNAVCKDYETSDESQISNSAFTAVYNISKNTVRGGLLSIFARLSDQGIEGRYKMELKKIQAVKNRYTRIRLAYELASKYQGRYDENQELNPFQFKKGYFLLTPTAVLNNAAKNGYGGVCRHFAALLEWTLLQVARGPDDQSFALSLNSFTVKSIASLSHVWVRVYLPFKLKDGTLFFDSIDLDPTNYEEAYPLIPKTKNGPNSELLLACKNMVRCID